MGVALVASALAVALACGTSRPAPAGDSTLPASDVDASAPGHDAASPFPVRDAGPSSDPYYNCEPVDAAPRQCPCLYNYSGSVTIELPCGVTLCSEGVKESAHCTVDGQLIIVPGWVGPYCDAGVQGDLVRPCDAGTLPLPPR
jgi:hypothetical protein